MVLENHTFAQIIMGKYGLKDGLFGFCPLSAFVENALFLEMPIFYVCCLFYKIQVPSRSRLFICPLKNFYHLFQVKLKLHRLPWWRSGDLFDCCASCCGRTKCQYDLQIFISRFECFGLEIKNSMEVFYQSIELSYNKICLY